jgi:hypothetical protein
VSQNTVQQFVELQNRLSSAGGLLDGHITLSAFFNLLESLTLSHVEFLSLKLTVADDHTATLDATGVAATFNALAAESKAFSANPQIKRAVFSNFVTQKDGGVSFNLTATISPAAVAAFGAATPAPAATTTPAVTSTSTPTTTGTVTPPAPAKATNTATPATSKTTTSAPPVPPPPAITP